MHEKVPSVKVGKEILESDYSDCAVCKDGFELDEEVKKLSCKHMYILIIFFLGWSCIIRVPFVGLSCRLMTRIMKVGLGKVRVAVGMRVGVPGKGEGEGFT